VAPLRPAGYRIETLTDDVNQRAFGHYLHLHTRIAASCGVARQYTGSAGKITNCQIGVFASYVSRHGHAFIDRALYLPKAWIDDAARLEATNAPAETVFMTKPQLAAAMIDRAIAARVPFAWVAADTVYGVGNIETALRRAGKGYVLGVSSAHWFGSWNRERPSVVLRKKLPRQCRHLTGTACRPVLEPKARGCMTGATSNWLILKPKTSTMKIIAFGHEVF
jgi:hypothetical protein